MKTLIRGLIFSTLSLSPFVAAQIIVTADPINLNDIFQITNKSSFEIDSKESSTQLTDLLKKQTGIQSFQSGGHGKQSSFFMRGGNRGDQGIFIDGVQLEDSLDIDRSIDLGTIGTQLFDQIEIYKGPQGILFGSNTLSGAINLKSNRKKRQFQILAGDKKTKSVTASSYHGPVSISASYFKSDNISSANEHKSKDAESDPFQRLSALASYEKMISQNVSFKFFTYQHRVSNEIDATNFSTSLPIDKRDSDLSITNYSLNSAKLVYKDFAGTIQSELLFNHKSSFRDSTGSRFEGEVKELIARNTFFINDQNVFNFSLETQEEKAINGSNINDRKMSEHLLSLNYLYQKRFIATQAGITAVKYESFEPILNYHAAMKFAISPLLAIQYQHSKGFKFPSLYQRFAPASSGFPIGNKDLKPASSYLHDFGLSYQKQLLSYKESASLNFFRQKYKNLISYTNSNGYSNTKMAKTYGVELAIKLSSKRFSLATVNTILRTEDGVEKKYLSRRPRYTNSTTLGFSPTEKDHLHYTLSYIGERNDNGRMPSYLLNDLQYVRDLKYHNGSVSLLVHNIFDRRYEQIRGFGTFGRSVQLKLAQEF